MKNPIYPCLWFDKNAKEAADYYCTVFKDTQITAENPIVVTFETAGQKFMCLNGGSEFKMNPSISFFVVCETEDEIMKAWNILIDGGAVLMALDRYEWSEKYGWIQDKFGVNWQLSFGKLADVGQKFTPTLMFTEKVHGKSEEAINFYTSVFKNSDIVGIMRYTKDDHDVAGTIKHAQFKLNKNVFMAMDSGLAKGFGFNEAISFVVECENQEEIDYYWEKLTEGGEESMCGWLKDKYGVSWQIIPEILNELMSNPEKSQKVVEAFLKMRKFDFKPFLSV